MLDSLRSAIGWIFGRLLVEWPARRRSMEGLIHKLERRGRREAAQLDASDETRHNRALLRHVICIDRWGQSRMKVLRGEPLVMDESDEYLPPEETSFDRLRQLFRATRDETVKLARELAESETAMRMSAPHNDFGPLSAHGWLRYLTQHSARELRKLE